MVKSFISTKQKDADNTYESGKDRKKNNEESAKILKKVNMRKLKNKIKEIMNENNYQDKNDNFNLFKDINYQKMFQNYINSEFSFECLNIINKIIINFKNNNLKKYQGIFELNKTFIVITKELLMNEFEILLLSLYLESVDISLYLNLFSLKESLLFLCYFIKKLTITPEKLMPINSYLIKKYQDFEGKFNKWFHTNSKMINRKLIFNYIEINEKFKEFHSPYNIYCKNDYMDYNLVIDRILTMSTPYNDNKNECLLDTNKETATITNDDKFPIKNYNNDVLNQLNDQNFLNKNMNSFLSFKDFKFDLPINQQPKFEDTIKNNNNNSASNKEEIITPNNLLYSLNDLNNVSQNNEMINKLSQPKLMGSMGSLGKLSDCKFNSQNSIHYMKKPSNLDMNIFGYSSLSNLDYEDNLKQIYNNSSDNIFRSLSCFGSSKNFFPYPSSSGNINNANNVNTFNQFIPINSGTPLINYNLANNNNNLSATNNLSKIKGNSGFINYGKINVIQNNIVKNNDNNNNKK